MTANLISPSGARLLEAYTDISKPQHVQVQFKEDGKVLWVNVDGVCVLRICQPQTPFILEDNRHHEREPDPS